VSTFIEHHLAVPVAFFVFSLDSGDVDVEPELGLAAAAIEPPDIALAEVFDDTAGGMQRGRASVMMPSR
jgi:hypothetical protein